MPAASATARESESYRAELELEQRRASWAAAQRRALARGVYPGATPIGYLRDEDGRMVPNPATAPLVRLLYERRLAGASWVMLARQLDREVPHGDGQRWRASTIADMLTTPMNIGRLERTVDGELVVVEDAHEPLVPRSLWEAVASGRASANGPVQRKEPAVLAGLVRCAGCGGPRSRAGKGRLNARGELVRHDRYTCLARCEKAATISCRAANRFVLERVLERLAVSPAVGQARRTGNEISQVERELELADAELAGYLRAVGETDMGEEAFAQGARERRERADAVRQRLAAIVARVKTAGSSHAELIELLSDPATSDRKPNTALRTLVERVVAEKAGQAGRRGDLERRLRIVFSDELAEDELEVGEHIRGEGSAAAA
jgi:hypothetical protein